MAFDAPVAPLPAAAKSVSISENERILGKTEAKLLSKLARVIGKHHPFLLLESGTLSAG